MNGPPNEPLRARGVRGATTVSADEPQLIHQATAELLEQMLAANDIALEDVAAVFFTTTADLTSTFPAEGARQLGMTSVPLMCSQEIPVPGRLPRAIRVMLLWNTLKRQQEIKHVYLHEAASLRPDLLSAQ